MSSDQRPGKIKIVQSSPAVPAVASDKQERADAMQSVEIARGSAAAADGTKQSSFGLGAVLFLCGCALGGVALAAWPHFGG